MGESPTTSTWTLKNGESLVVEVGDQIVAITGVGRATVRIVAPPEATITPLRVDRPKSAGKNKTR